MNYEKPKVTIDLAEYNELLAAKEKLKLKVDPDEVATTAALAMVQIDQYRSTNPNEILEQLTRDKNFSLIFQSGIQMNAPRFFVKQKDGPKET